MTAAEAAGVDEASTRILDLDVSGMTCASCAQRVERKLNRIPGATASVNLATERARVELPATAPDSTALAAVRAAGYAGTVRAAAPAPRDRANHPAASENGETSTPGPTPPDPDDALLRRRLIVSTALALPVVVLSMVPVLQFANWQWLAFALASPIAVWGAWPFHRAAAVQARHGGAGMDTLISLGVMAAYGWSVWALFAGGAGMPGMHMRFQLVGRPEDGASDIYLEVVAAVTVFLLGGRWLEARARGRSGAALRSLLELGAREATVIVDGREQRVAAWSLAPGDVIVVRPGEKIATDGVVVGGASAVDSSLLTGESVPVEVAGGDEVAGGTLNVGGHLTIRATRVGEQTQLAHIARLVEEAQTGKAEVQRLADRISAVFVPVVILLALGTFAIWLVTGHSLTLAVTAAVATLIVACPCALGLATPTALLVGTGAGATRGILIRGPQVIESADRIDTVVLDKTGTLTTGRLRVVDVVPAAGQDAGALLDRAAALERLSEHPVARAVAAAAADRSALPSVESFASTAGLGVHGTIAGESVAVGRASWLASTWSVSPDDGLARSIASAEESGLTVVVVAWDGAVRGILTVGDTVRESSAAAVTALRGLGLTPVLVTGDNEGAARRVADEVGIDMVLSGVLPEGKLDVVRVLQAEGHAVAMVGDGVNDAAALAGADVGIAMGGGTDAAIEASDITLVRDDLLLVADALTLSRRTLRVIRSNLFWAFAYNVAALPIAMLGLLNPVVSGLAMALSSLVVVGNSLRLRRA